MTRTLTTEQLSAVETTKEFRAMLKYMRAIAKAEPESAKEKFELEEGLWRYASQKTIKAIVEHIDALEFALAANREAQPVQVTDGMALDFHHALTDGSIGSDELEEIKVGLRAALCNVTAPSAPAVPPEKKLPELMMASYHEAIGWNACRAAMLAQPVSSGYKLNSPEIPDGWIACSEQMPELDKRVLLYFDSYDGHIEDGCIGDDGDGPYHYFFDGDSLQQEPTHWMPLPAAPEGGNDHDTRR